MTNPSPEPRAQAASRLRQIAFGLRAAQALHVAAKLNIADQLSHGPLDCSELAKRAGANVTAVRRLMRALCALGVFAEATNGQFSLLPPGELLRNDVPDSYRAAVLFLAGDVRWRCWSQLLRSVQTGSSSVDQVFGMSLFDFYAANPEESEIHDRAMRGISAAQIAAVLRAVDFSHAGVVVDVGGGTGELVAAIVAAHPSLRGILFDLPHVVAHAGQLLKNKAVADRVQIVGGSFFENVPRGGSTYMMKSVIHDWDDARALAILRACREAMSPGNRLFILDRELPSIGAAADRTEAFLLDLEMLVMTPGGRERTKGEFASLLTDSGFELTSAIATDSPLTVFEARPV